jgi:mannose/fructose/N-acetylgalactosamine-specific phosphotransferase system component IIB
VTLVWTRVDQKLIHGQIAVAWVPHLSIDAVVVGDSDAADDPWVQKVMTMGLPPEVTETRFVAPAGLADLLAGGEWASRRVLVIFKDIDGVMEAVRGGLRLTRLNLGNQAARPGGLGGGRRLTDAFYVSDRDVAGLAELSGLGLEVQVQAVPAEKAVAWKP